MSTETADPQTWTLAARIVFPPSGEEDTLPLYVDFGRATPIEEKPNGNQPQVQANNANTHRLRRAGDTRRSVSQDLNAELERLNQPAAARK